MGENPLYKGIQKGALYGILGLATFLGSPKTPAVTDLISRPVAAQEEGTTKRHLDNIVNADSSNYRKIIENNKTVFVMYYSSKDDGYDKHQKYSWNEHASKFMNWVIEHYRNKIDTFIIVELPYNEERGSITKEGWSILKKEVGQKRYPSFALYYNGKPITRMRGPPRDSDVREDYKSIGRVLDMDISNANIFTDTR